MSAESDLKEIEMWVVEAGEHSTRALRDLLAKLRHRFGLATASIDEPVDEPATEDSDESDDGGEDEAEASAAPRRRTRS